MLLENKKITNKIAKYSFPLVLNSVINTIYGLTLIFGYSHINENIAIIILAINSLNFLLLGSLGYISSAIQIENKKSEDQDTLFSSAFACAVLLGLILLGTFLVFGQRFCYYYYSFTGTQLENAYQYMIFIGISAILTLLLFVVNAILKINENTAVLGKINVISSLISLVIFILVILLNPTILMFGIWSLIYPAVCLIISYYTMRTTTKFNFVQVDRKLIKNLLKSTFTMGVQELFDTTILLFFLETLLANYDHNIYQSYLINMQLLNYIMIPIYMISSSLYVFIKNLDEDNQFFTNSLKLNILMYSLLVVLLIIIIRFIYVIFVPEEIPFEQFKMVFYLLFSSNIMLPIYITYRTLAQCYDLSGKLLIPTVVINLLTVLILFILNSLLSNIIVIAFVVVALNYFILTFLTRNFLVRRFL